jgi:hypothetical protein
MDTEPDNELDRLLSEQLAYYRALGPDYLHQGQDLPGDGGELAEALEAHSSRRAACSSSPAVPASGPASYFAGRPTSPLSTGPRRCSPSRRPESAATGCASFRPISSAGGPTAATTWSSSASSCRTSRRSASRPSGRWWPTPSNRAAAFSSPTTRTGPRTNSLTAGIFIAPAGISCCYLLLSAVIVLDWAVFLLLLAGGKRGRRIVYIHGPARGGRGTRSSGMEIFLLLSVLLSPLGNTGHGRRRWGGKGTQSVSAARWSAPRPGPLCRRRAVDRQAAR